MALRDRLRHTIVIERPSESGAARVDRTAPAVTWTAVATVRAWVQPVDGVEVPSASGAGPVIATHRTFLMPTDIRESDVFHLLPDDGQRHHVIRVEDAAGKGVHLEVLSTTTTTGGA